MAVKFDLLTRITPSIASAEEAHVEYAAGHKNMLQLIELRWIAVIGQITTIAAAILIFRHSRSAS